jgi:hypothetical protein
MRVASTKVSSASIVRSYMDVESYHCIAIRFPNHFMKGLWLNYGERANSAPSVRITDGVDGPGPWHDQKKKLWKSKKKGYVPAEIRTGNSQNTSDDPFAWH